MDFGLVTVARAAQIPAARAMIESARRAGFTGTVHAILLDLDVNPSAIGAEWVNFQSVMPDPAVARQLTPLGLDDLYPAVVPHAIVYALRSESAVVYLAPTVRVLAPLDDFAACAGAQIALVEQDHRFSMSIVAATRAAMPALEWWRATAWADLLGDKAPDAAPLVDRVARRYGAATAPDSTRLIEDTDEPDPAVDEPPILANDLPFDRVMREAYRMHLRDALDQQGPPPPNPYEDPTSFVEWLQQSQFPTTVRVSRYLRQVYLSRPDLSRAFPEVPGRDTARFFAWANDHGRDDVPIPAPLLPPRQATERPRSRVRPATTSVNLVGFLDASLGIGEVARRIGSALDAADITFAEVPFARARPERLATFDVRSAPHDINLVCINPDTLASFAEHVGESFFAGRYTIGVWFWETAELPPSMAWAFDLVDEVWAASHFVADAIRARAPSRVPVNVVTLPLVAPVVDPAFRLTDVGLAEGKVAFVTSWDYLSVADRKNPLGAVAAYTAAFTADDGAQLLLKGTNAAQRPDDHQRVHHATLDRPDIHLFTDYLSPEKYAAVLAGATAVVSLHRSEGLALNLADAIALGVPAIATAYGGNLMFMDTADTDLVPFQLIDIGQGHHPYPSDAQWAEPDYAFAAKCMRQIVEDPNRAHERAQQAQRRITDDFSAMNAAESVAQLLATIVQRAGAGASRRSRLRRPFHRPS